jgi:hypothetical protein
MLRPLHGVRLSRLWPNLCFPRGKEAYLYLSYLHTRPTISYPHPYYLSYIEASTCTHILVFWHIPWLTHTHLIAMEGS